MKAVQQNQFYSDSLESISEVHNYCGSPIAFIVKGDIMVNATQMAKPFGKLPADFIRLQGTGEYLQALTNRYGKSHSALLQVVNGGTNPGTWMHQKLALRYAQWLSPEFAVWVDQKIEELLTTGRAEIQQKFLIPNSFSEALRLAAEQAEQLEEQQKLIEAAKPKVEAYYELMTCTNAISMQDLAKVLAIDGMGRTNLFKYLRNKGILANGNRPYQEYINRGWFKMKQSPWKNPHTGERKVSVTTEVMPAGVDGIRRMLRKDSF